MRNPGRWRRLAWSRDVLAPLGMATRRVPLVDCAALLSCGAWSRVREPRGGWCERAVSVRLRAAAERLRLCHSARTILDPSRKPPNTDPVGVSVSSFL